jgi:hypothetical protein
MDVTAVTATYAALVATGAASIQLVQWRGTRTQVRFEANAGLAPIETNQRDAFGNSGSAPDEVLFIHITNRSPHAVKITHLGAMTTRRRKRKGVFFSRPYPLHLRLPLEVAARDRVTLWQPRAGLGKWESERMRIVVRTAAGDDFESKPLRLNELARLEALP